MISCPQGDVKHTGHLGLDGAYFGDVDFMHVNATKVNNMIDVLINMIVIFLFNYNNFLCNSSIITYHIKL